MQRITVPLILTFVVTFGGAALVSSAMQAEPSPIPPELKDPPQGPTPGNPTDPHIPIPPEVKPGENPGPGPSNGNPHIPIPPEIKGSPSPVPPENFIVLNGLKLIASGGADVVYSVPSDRWLVLTDMEANWPTGGTPVLSERMGGLTTDKRTNFLGTAYHSFTGIAFQPGSQVVLRETSLHSPVNVAFSFTGMLVKPAN